MDNKLLREALLEMSSALAKMADAVTNIEIINNNNVIKELKDVSDSDYSKLMSFSNESEFNNYASLLYGSDGWKWKSWTLFMKNIGSNSPKAVEWARNNGYGTSVFDCAVGKGILNVYVDSVMEIINNK